MAPQHSYPVLLWLAVALALYTPGTSASAVLPLTAAYYGTAFDVNVTFDQRQTFLLQVDTGSADTWVLGEGWECLQESANGAIQQVPHKTCKNGNATFDYERENSGFTMLDDEWLGVLYGAGPVYGLVGYEDIQVGDVAIKQQQIGVVNESRSVSDGINVGLLALGYPSLSFIHSTSLNLNDTLNETESLTEDRLRYPTFSQRLKEDGIGFVSFALERTERDEEVGFGGYMGIGTLPPVGHGSFVSTPVEVDKSIPVKYTNNTAQITEWLLTVPSMSFRSEHGGEHNITTPFQAIVDTGTSNNLLPEEIATAVNAAFDPPATRLTDGSGEWSVACNATAPSFHIEIGGAVFSVDRRDMIWQNPSGRCYSNVASSAASEVEGVSFNILGSCVMKNLVVVFDMGKDEFRIAQRQVDSPKENAGATQQVRLIGMSSLVWAVCAWVLLLQGV